MRGDWDGAGCVRAYRSEADGMKQVLLFLISFYRAAISPLFPPTCRYVPTCSAYAMTAIARYGARRGGMLALRRILHCHPFHAGGYDPVP